MTDVLVHNAHMESDSNLCLYLFFDGGEPPVLPSPYDEMEPEEHSVCLQECDGMPALNTELERAGRVLNLVKGKGLILSIYRRQERVVAGAPAVCLSKDLLQRMSACGVGLDYSLYTSRWRETRFRRVMSFFLLTFPQGGAGELPSDEPWLFAGEYRGKHFVLTPDIGALAAYLTYLADSGRQLPELRVDYFSAGSAVMWYLEAEDEIRALAALGCGVELRVHLAMLLSVTDPLFPLFRYLMRSTAWRSRLLPPPEQTEEEAR